MLRVLMSVVLVCLAPRPQSGTEPKTPDPTPYCASGCHLERAEDGGYTKGFRFEVQPLMRDHIKVQAVFLGWSGACIDSALGCMTGRPCRMTVAALISNACDFDLWFQVDGLWMDTGLLDQPRPDKDGWVRVPAKRSALYFSGPYVLACNGLQSIKTVELWTRKQGGERAARLFYSATCSQCPAKLTAH